MEQFLPAISPAAWKTAITVLAADHTSVKYIPARSAPEPVTRRFGADAGQSCRLLWRMPDCCCLNLETGHAEPRMLAAETLAATIKETVNTVAELPEHVLENEMLLSDAVHEAFENAAASYFPDSMIKPPRIRESGERHGKWHAFAGQVGTKAIREVQRKLCPSRFHRALLAISTPSGTLPCTTTFVINTATMKLGLTKVTSRRIKRFQQHARARLRAQGSPRISVAPVRHARRRPAHCWDKMPGWGDVRFQVRYPWHPEKLHSTSDSIAFIHRRRRHHHLRHVHSEVVINLLGGEISALELRERTTGQRIVADLGKLTTKLRRLPS